MRTWLLTLGFLVLLPAVYLQYIGLNAYLTWHTGTPLILAYLVPGVILVLLGFRTSPKLQVAKP